MKAILLCLCLPIFFFSSIDAAHSQKEYLYTKIAILDFHIYSYGFVSNEFTYDYLVGNRDAYQDMLDRLSHE